MTGPRSTKDERDTTGIGATIFADYRQRVEWTTESADRRIGLPDLLLAIGGNVAAVGFCFAPWMRYQQRMPDSSLVPGQDTGFATDGWVLLAASIVAVIAFVVAAVRADQSMPATIGFAATVIAFITAGTCWMMIDMLAPVGAEDVHAAWGVVATTAASIVATIFAFRAMRTARIY